MMNRETVEKNDSFYEIYYEDDGGCANNSTDFCATNASSFPGEPFNDVDGDVAFGTLIISELQKMAPDAKREFKRNVTQMLFW